MTKRLLLAQVAACAVLLIALGVGLTLGISDEPREELTGGPTQERTPRPPAPPADAAERGLRRPVQAETEESAASPTMIDLTARTVELSGALTVIDSSGFEAIPESASFKLLAAGEDREVAERIEVREGRWSVAVPLDAWITIHELRADGRPMMCQPEVTNRPIPRTAFLELRALEGTARAEATLRVISRTDQRDLDDVHVVWAGPLANGVHPAAWRSHILIEGGRSPVAIPREVRGWEAQRNCAVRAAGHGWEPFDLRAWPKGERVVRLDPAGSVSIHVVRSDDAAPVSLRMRRSSDSWSGSYLDLPLTTDQVTLDAVGEGEYVVTAEIGHSWESIVLATQAVEVVRDRRSDVVLVLDAPPDAGLVPLAGTLSVALELLETSFDVFARLDSPALSPGDHFYRVEHADLDPLAMEGDYAWDLGKVQPGRYELQVYPFPERWYVGVGPDGKTDAHLEVSSRAKVVVEVVDDAGGSTGPPSIRWSSNGSSEIVYRHNKTGLFEFYAPLGMIFVRLSGDGYESNSTNVEVLPGVNRVQLEAMRVYEFVLRLKDGRTRIPLPSDFQLQIESVDGRGQSLGWSSFRDTKKYRVSSPGRYRLTGSEVEGYLPIPESEVVVNALEPVVHVIRLERAPMPPR